MIPFACSTLLHAQIIWTTNGVHSTSMKYFIITLLSDSVPQLCVLYNFDQSVTTCDCDTPDEIFIETPYLESCYKAQI
jgi:hypothetical protein